MLLQNCLSIFFWHRKFVENEKDQVQFHGVIVHSDDRVGLWPDIYNICLGNIFIELLIHKSLELLRKTYIKPTLSSEKLNVIRI